MNQTTVAPIRLRRVHSDDCVGTIRRRVRDAAIRTYRDRGLRDAWLSARRAVAGGVEVERVEAPVVFARGPQGMFVVPVDKSNRILIQREDGLPAWR